MDPSRLQPLSIKKKNQEQNIVSENGGLFGLYLLFSLRDRVRAICPGSSVAMERKNTNGREMIKVILPSLSSVDEHCPPQRSCRTNLSLIFGPLVLMDLLVQSIAIL